MQLRVLARARRGMHEQRVELWTNMHAKAENRKSPRVGTLGWDWPPSKSPCNCACLPGHVVACMSNGWSFEPICTRKLKQEIPNGWEPLGWDWLTTLEPLSKRVELYQTRLPNQDFKACYGGLQRGCGRISSPVTRAEIVRKQASAKHERKRVELYQTRQSDVTKFLSLVMAGFNVAVGESAARSPQQRLWGSRLRQSMNENGWSFIRPDSLT